MLALKIVLLAVCSYLLGNVNFALIISKFLKQDVRKLGSGNPGSMNMFRNYGVGIGLLTLILDALKGALPCVVGWWLLGENFKFGGNRIGLYIGALSVIVGHIFPVFLKFKGGKGIASSIGICAVANPIATLICFVVGVLFLIVTKMGSITSFLIISFPLGIEALKTPVAPDGLAISILIFSIFALTLFAHRSNVVKLFKGKENKTVLFKRKSKKL